MRGRPAPWFVPSDPLTRIDPVMPGDIRPGGLKARCWRAVQTLTIELVPRGRSAEVAWDLLDELAGAAAQACARWAGAWRACRVLGGMAAGLEALDPRRFDAPEAAQASELALHRARGLFDELACEYPPPPGGPRVLAWALLAATLEEARQRFGPAGAAEIARRALTRILPPTRGAPAMRIPA